MNRSQCCRLAGLSLLIAATWASAAVDRVVAHWRFDGGVPGAVFSPETPVVDLSGNANRLQTFSPDTAPSYSNDVWPGRRGSGRTSLNNAAVPGNRQPTRDMYVDPHAGATFDLTQDDLVAFTVEAIVKIDGSVENWERRFQTVIGRDGYNLTFSPADRENALSNLALKKRGDTNKFSFEAFDSAGRYVTVESKEAVKAGVWYALAAVCDGKSIALYLKEGAEGEYILQGRSDFQGPLLNGGRIWSVGRGAHMNHPAEQFFGLVDEIRVSAQAVDVPDMLGRSGGAEIRETKVGVQRQVKRSWPQRTNLLVGAHDPTVVLDEKQAFHMFSSHGNLMHWKSDDLVHWTRLPSVFDKSGVPEWAKREISPRAGLWAPEVLYFNGRYHIYYSCSTFGSQRSAIGMAWTRSLDPASPEYGWTDEGKVFESNRGDPYNAIDAAPLMDAQGEPWMAFGSWNRGLFLIKLDKETGKQSTSDTRAYHLWNRPGKDAIEAPALFYRDGWYYLLGSWDFCCRGAGSTYKVLMGRSKNITGPYLDRQGRPLLEGHGSLLIRSYGFYAGPGQGNLIQRGDQTYFVHHYYDLRERGVPTVSTRKVYWDAEGWPFAGEDLVEESANTKAVNLAGRYDVLFDYAKPETWTLREDGTLSAGSRLGTWKLADGRLTIKWADQAELDCVASETLSSFVGRVSGGSGDGEIIRATRSKE